MSIFLNKFTQSRFWDIFPSASDDVKISKKYRYASGSWKKNMRILVRPNTNTFVKAILLLKVSGKWNLVFLTNPSK